MHADGSGLCETKQPFEHAVESALSHISISAFLLFCVSAFISMSTVHPQTASALFTREYQSEMEDWLRRRFRSFCIACIVIVSLGVARDLVLGRYWQGLFISIPAALLSIGVISSFALSRKTEDATREQIIAISSTLILVLGAVAILSEMGRMFAYDSTPHILYRLFLWHVVACLFLPWTSWESLKPFVPLVIAWVIGVLLMAGNMTFTERMLTIVFGPFVFLPGVAICIVRLRLHSQDFRERMVGKHFLSLREEIGRARAIHETMFPKPYDDGYINMDYAFQPTRDMGGDYIHLHVGPEGIAHVTVLDVTGHGLVAALTVNRLYGELERIRAEMPRVEPVDVLRLINRYVHLTLARHNMFVTAACLSLDPYQGLLRWASAGHPPGFLRRQSGEVVELPPTAMILGAMDDEGFVAEQVEHTIEPGDTAIAYTDGVFEARNRAGAIFGLDTLRDLLHRQPAPRNWPQFLNSMVEKHTGGRAEDDVLVAAVRFERARMETDAGSGSQSTATAFVHSE